MDCIHEWNITSPLRLIVSRPEIDWMGAIIPTPPTLLPVEFCHVCGVLRIPLEAARAAADEART